VLTTINVQAQERFLNQIVRILDAAPATAQQPAEFLEEDLDLAHAVNVSRTDGRGNVR
jgi:hypothetical protein